MSATVNPQLDMNIGGLLIFLPVIFSSALLTSAGFMVVAAASHTVAAAAASDDFTSDLGDKSGSFF